jgi:hypothetical protein
MLRRSRKILILLFALVLFGAAATTAENSGKKSELVEIPGYPKPFPAELLAQNQPPRSFEIIAHRGAKKFAPDNTLPAIAAAIAMGIDYVELDVRTTKDNQLIIMHNATVERSTNGTGAVRDLTLEQIQALDAGGSYGPEFKGTRVPTFEQALALMEGKIGLYLDTKDVDPKAAAVLLEKYHMAERTVVYCDYISAKAWLKAAKGVRPCPRPTIPRPCLWRSSPCRASRWWPATGNTSRPKWLRPSMTRA